jgi:hypothetical protein
MPKKLINDYVFYKIVCLDNSVDLCYIGSTANWKARNHNHKNNCNNEKCKAYNYKIYKTIRDNSGWSNFKMVEIGKKEQLTKRQAEQIEEEYRIELKANMNGKRCFATKEQRNEQMKEYNKNYIEENIDKIKIQKHNWYENNRDNILDKSKIYRDVNKDKIKERDKNYREANKDKLLDKSKIYRDENREILNMKQNEKINCDCGCSVNKSFLGKHKKSPKHIKLMNQIKI